MEVVNQPAIRRSDLFAPDQSPVAASEDARKQNDETVGNVTTFFMILLQYSLEVIQHGKETTVAAIKRHKATMEARQEGERMSQLVDGLQAALAKNTDPNATMPLDPELIAFLTEHNIYDYKKKVADDKAAGKETPSEINLVTAQKLAIEMNKYCSGLGNLEEEQQLGVTEAMSNYEGGTKMATAFFDRCWGVLKEILRGIGT